MEILNFRKQENSSIVALFSVYLDKIGITFHNFKLIKTKAGSLFVSGPSYAETKTDGKKEYYPYIEFSENRGKEFNEKVMELLKPLCEG